MQLQAPGSARRAVLPVASATPATQSASSSPVIYYGAQQTVLQAAPLPPLLPQAPVLIDEQVLNTAFWNWSTQLQRDIPARWFLYGDREPIRVTFNNPLVSQRFEQNGSKWTDANAVQLFVTAAIVNPTSRTDGYKVYRIQRALELNGTTPWHDLDFLNELRTILLKVNMDVDFEKRVLGKAWNPIAVDQAMSFGTFDAWSKSLAEFMRLFDTLQNSTIELFNLVNRQIQAVQFANGIPVQPIVLPRDVSISPPIPIITVKPLSIDRTIERSSTPMAQTAINPAFVRLPNGTYSSALVSNTLLAPASAIRSSSSAAFGHVSTLAPPPTTTVIRSMPPTVYAVPANIEIYRSPPPSSSTLSSTLQTTEQRPPAVLSSRIILTAPSPPKSAPVTPLLARSFARTRTTVVPPPPPSAPVVASTAALTSQVVQPPAPTSPPPPPRSVPAYRPPQSAVTMVPTPTRVPQSDQPAGIVAPTSSRIIVTKPPPEPESSSPAKQQPNVPARTHVPTSSRIVVTQPPPEPESSSPAKQQPNVPARTHVPQTITPVPAKSASPAQSRPSSQPQVIRPPTSAPRTSAASTASVGSASATVGNVTATPTTTQVEITPEIIKHAQSIVAAAELDKAIAEGELRADIERQRTLDALSDIEKSVIKKRALNRQGEIDNETEKLIANARHSAPSKDEYDNFIKQLNDLQSKSSRLGYLSELFAMSGGIPIQDTIASVDLEPPLPPLPDEPQPPPLPDNPTFPPLTDVESARIDGLKRKAAEIKDLIDKKEYKNDEKRDELKDEYDELLWQARPWWKPNDPVDFGMRDLELEAERSKFLHDAADASLSPQRRFELQNEASRLERLRQRLRAIAYPTGSQTSDLEPPLPPLPDEPQPPPLPDNPPFPPLTDEESARIDGLKRKAAEIKNLIDKKEYKNDEKRDELKDEYDELLWQARPWWKPNDPVDFGMRDLELGAERSKFLHDAGDASLSPQRRFELQNEASRLERLRQRLRAIAYPTGSQPSASSSPANSSPYATTDVISSSAGVFTSSLSSSSTTSSITSGTTPAAIVTSSSTITASSPSLTSGTASSITSDVVSSSVATGTSPSITSTTSSSITSDVQSSSSLSSTGTSSAATTGTTVSSTSSDVTSSSSTGGSVSSSTTGSGTTPVVVTEDQPSATGNVPKAPNLDASLFGSATGKPGSTAAGGAPKETPEEETARIVAERAQRALAGQTRTTTPVPARAKRAPSKLQAQLQRTLDRPPPGRTAAIPAVKYVTTEQAYKRVTEIQQELDSGNALSKGFGYVQQLRDESEQLQKAADDAKARGSDITTIIASTP